MASSVIEEAGDSSLSAARFMRTVSEKKNENNGQVDSEVSESCGAYDAGVDVEGQESVRNATVFASTVNMVNIIIGAGILALPYAFSQCGWLLSLALLAMSAFFSFLGLHFLTACCHALGGTNTSIGALVSRVFPRLTVVVDLMMAALCFGVCISYLIVVGDLGPQVAAAVLGAEPTSTWTNRQLWTTLGFAVFGIPLGCLRELNSLRFTSAIAVGAILYIVVLITVFKVAPAGGEFDACVLYPSPEECHGTVAVTKSGITVLSALPVFVNAFCAHTNIAQVYNEIQCPSVRRVDTASASALTIVAAFYTLVGLCGYLTYGDKVSSNILLDYPLTIPVTVCRIMVMLLVLFSYPVLTQPTRQAIMHILEYVPPFSHNEHTDGLIRYWGTTMVVLFGTYTVSLFVDNLGVVYGVIGATASTAATLILPGALYFVMFRHTARSLFDRVLLVLAVVSSAWGVVFVPLALYSMFA